MKMLMIFFVFIKLLEAEVLPSIFWDPNNPLFSCPNVEIKVQRDDKITFIHPNKNIFPRLQVNADKDIFYNKIYYTDVEEAADTCNSTEAKEISGTEVVNNDGKGLFATDVIFNGIIGDLYKHGFSKGKTYYFYSTSTGTRSGIDNPINGSCAGSPGFFPLKVAIKVCSDEEIITGRCERCNSTACYTKECGFTNWKNSSDYLWTGKNCYEKLSRSCISSYACHGATERVQQVDKGECNSICIQSSVLPSNSLSSSTTQCLTQTVSKTVTLTTTAQCSPSVVISNSIATSTITVERIVTETRTVTTTSMLECSAMTSIRPPFTEKVISYEDISYDKKFYITVISAIVGSIIVGVFVLHACVSYHQGKRLTSKVLTVEQYQSLQEKPSVVYVEEFNENRSQQDDAGSSKMSPKGTLINTTHS